MAYQPKSYKKFVATAATATLVASAVVPVAFAAQTATDFTDVAPQYKEAVDYLVDNTIAAGKTPSTFGTAEPIIRVDAAIWIAKATLTEGEISAAPASEFTDVPDRGVIYVDALKSKGYVNGTSNTSYNSYANISRGEVALILAEAYDITGDAANNSFTDVGARYTAAVAALKDNGITSGKTSTRFGTNDQITRGELAIWVYKLETLDALTVSNINVAVEGSKATVTADVKNAEENADATVSVYPKGDLSATPIVNTVKVVDGKVTTAFNGVPAGNHVVVVKVGEVSSSKNFSVVLTDPTVLSVSAVNSKEVQIKFSEAIDEDSVITDGTLNAGVFKINNAEPVTDAAYLSEDKTVLTLVSTDAWDGQYSFELLDEQALTLNEEFVASFSSFFTADDNLRAALSSTDYVSKFVYDINFSEPVVDPTSSMQFSYEDSTLGAVPVPTLDFSDDMKSVRVTFQPTTEVGEAINVLFPGLVDYAGNTSVPLTSKITISNSDKTKPVVNSIATTGFDGTTTAFQVKLSEAVKATSGTFSVNGTTANFTVNSNDSSILNATVAGEIKGSNLVYFPAGTFTDLNENSNAEVGNFYTFVQDEAAPTLSNSSVTRIGGVEYLVLSFNENVNLNTLPTSLSFRNVNEYGIEETTTDDSPEITMHDVVNGKSSKVKIKLDVLDDTTAYKVTLGAGLVEDSYDNSSAQLTNVSFATTDVDAGVGDTNQVTVSSTATAGKVIINFSNPVNVASAQNVNNYSVEQATVKTATVVANSSNGATVELQLTDDTVELDGTYNVTVKPITSFNSLDKANTTKIVPVQITENIRPKVTSKVITQLSENDIVVKLNVTESLTNGLGNDFELYVNGIATGDYATSTVSGTNSTELSLSFTDSSAEYSNFTSATSIKFVPVSTLDLTDAKSNKLLSADVLVK